MKINGTDISTFGAKQWNFTYEHSDVQNDSAWAVGAAVPYFAKNNIGFSSFTVTLMMKAAGRKEIRRACSNILSLLLGPAVLELDGFDTKFKAILQSHSETERALRQYHLLQLTFLGYEYGADVTSSGTGEVTIANAGNIISPVYLTVVPSADGTIQIDGFTDLITIEDCTAGQTIQIDGINGMVMDGDAPKIADVEMWTLPQIAPGESRIVCSDSSAIISVTVTPLYM